MMAYPIEFLKKIIPRNAGYFLRKIKLFVRGLFYRGTNFFCPICNKGYRTFFEGGFNLAVIGEYQIIGAGLRKNAICPGCASNDRDRLLYLALNDKNLKLLPADSILHIAPEPSLAGWIETKQRKNKGSYTKGVKYHEGFYYGNDVQLMDLLHLPFDDNSFDLLICNHVLEHIPDDIGAMREIHRVMKPGSKSILQVPWSPLLNKTFEDNSITKPKEREEKFGQFDHVRLYGTDYPQRLESAGFQVETISVSQLNLPDNILISYGLNRKEIIFVAKKLMQTR
ncbi:MAG: putative methyltransferase [Bacteroidetes bacterium]|nr:MAG: putative methyltransferase [Bacteroidota bacterium]